MSSGTRHETKKPTASGESGVARSERNGGPTGSRGNRPSGLRRISGSESRRSGETEPRGNRGIAGAGETGHKNPGDATRGFFYFLPAWKGKPWTMTARIGKRCSARP